MRNRDFIPLRTQAFKVKFNTSWRSQRNIYSPQRKLWVSCDHWRGDIDNSEVITEVDYVARFASLVSICDANPQLPLWATNMPPAMRALQTSEAIQRQSCPGAGMLGLLGDSNQHELNIHLSNKRRVEYLARAVHAQTQENYEETDFSRRSVRHLCRHACNCTAID
jgi:hypothetical protein